MKTKKYIFIFFIFCIIYSCTSPNSKISSAENIITNTEVNYENYKEEDWGKLDTVISQLQNDIDKNRDNYTPEQLEKANKLIGRSSVLQLKRGLKDFKLKMEDLKQQVKGAVETISDTTSSK